MFSRQTRFIRVAALSIIAASAILLLIGLLNQHFTRPITTWKTSSKLRFEESGHVKHHEPFVLGNEIKPTPKTSADKRIYTGLYIENIYSLSVKDRTFMVEGSYWLKWPEAINNIIKENAIPQEKLIEFVNQVESSSMVVQVDQPNPELLSNGSYWQVFHFSGRFYIDNLELQSFPFESLQLPVILELGPDYLSCRQGNRYGCISLALDNEKDHSILGRNVSLNGYSVIGSTSKEFLHQYPTNFGNGKPSSYSSVETRVLYHTIFAAAFWNYIFPLLVLIGIALISPSLSGALGDVRLAIPTTILLTLIFLQIGYKADLPTLAYVTYLDWLYIYAYVASAALFILFCWSTNAHATAAAWGNEEIVMRRINRVDVLVQSIAFAGLLLVIASGLMFEP
jgi:hypothetical protein